MFSLLRFTVVVGSTSFLVACGDATHPLTGVLQGPVVRTVAHRMPRGHPRVGRPRCASTVRASAKLHVPRSSIALPR
jgi:hypothetical protein